MHRYPNLPREQWFTQRIADSFNADEAHWRSLEARRNLRRKYLRLTERQHEMLDLLEFSRTRPPDDCVAQSSYDKKEIA